MDSVGQLQLRASRSSPARSGACGAGALLLASVALLAVPTNGSGAPLTASVAAWGSNTVDQTAVPAGLTNAMAVAGGTYHSLAVRADRTVVGWGDPSYGKSTPPDGLTNVISVGAGLNHSLALKGDGTVFAWGANDGGQTNTPAISGAVAIAAGDYFNLALLYNGSVVAWGGSPPNMPPGVASGQDAVTAIAAGASYAAAVVHPFGGQGRVVLWGSLTPDLARLPEELTNGLANVVAVAAGNSHCIALKSDGTVRGWGSNFKNQAIPPAGLNGVVAIAARGDFSLALRYDGIVVGWGANDLGQISPPADLTNVVAIAAGMNHGLALFWEPVEIVSQPQRQTVVAGNPALFSVAASGSQPIAYQWKRNGTNIAGATNASYVIQNVQASQAGTYTVDVTNPVGGLLSSNATLTVLTPPSITIQPQDRAVQQSAIVSFSVAVSGTPPLAFQWRKNGVNLPGATANPFIIPSAQPADAGSYTVVVTNIAGAITSAPATLTVYVPPVIVAHPQSQTVAAGSSVSFTVLATAAETYQWRRNGANLAGAAAATYTINSAQTNDAGSYTVVVSNNGGSVTSQAATLVVLAPGTNFHLAHWGQSLVFNGVNYVDVTPPGGITGAVAIAVGGNHSLALKHDGTVTGWGDNTHGQAANPGLTGGINLAAGLNHSLALRSNRTVVAWGQNDLGQATVPAGLNNVVAIAAGSTHSLALRTNGTAVGWGDNTFGKATPVPWATNLVAIAAGADHSLGLRADGTVVAWGGNDDGQLQVPIGLTDVLAIAAGSHHSLALKRDGTVVGWGALRGLYDYGQAQPPAGLRNVMAIAAGGTHSLALRRDNTVVGWGNNNYGQTDSPAALNGVAMIAAGPTRSLALRLKMLRLAPPERLGGGLYRLMLGNVDGSPLETNRLDKISLYASTNWTEGGPVWMPLTNSLAITNGRAILVVTNLPAIHQRSYLAIERP